MRRPIGIFGSAGASSPAMNPTAGLTITEVGAYRYYVFTASGDFTLNRAIVNGHFIGVGGGGGGGKSSASSAGGGGGGGGCCGYVVDTMNPGTFSIAIAGGGPGQTNTTTANGSGGGTSTIYIRNTSYTATFVNKVAPYWFNFSGSDWGYYFEGGAKGGGTAQTVGSGTGLNGNMIGTGGGGFQAAGGTGDSQQGASGGTGYNSATSGGAGGGATLRNLTYADPAWSTTTYSATGGNSSGGTSAQAYGGTGGWGFPLNTICLDTDTGGGRIGLRETPTADQFTQLGFGGGGGGGGGGTSNPASEWDGYSYTGGGSYVSGINGYVKSGGGGAGGRRGNNGGNGGSGVVIFRELI